jgi:hypothetical protein
MLLLLVHTLREVDNMYKDKNMLVSGGLLGWLSMQSSWIARFWTTTAAAGQAGQ